MGYTFTEEDRKRGAAARNAVLTPQKRKEISRRAGYRRWYKVNDSDMDRVDRHLRVLSGIVGVGMATDDYILVLRTLTAMAPYERMKIALNSGMFDVTPKLEDQSQIEKKLADSRARREARFAQPDEAETVEVTPEPEK